MRRARMIAVALTCWRSCVPKFGCMPLQSKEGPVGSNPFTARSAKNFLEFKLWCGLVTVATMVAEDMYGSHG